MGLIQAPFAPLLPFRRPVEDNDGNIPSFTDLGSVASAVQFTGQGDVTGSGRGRGEVGLINLPRGTDIRVGDQFEWTNGKHYTITGGPRGDMDHIFTGADFGWVEYDFAGAKIRWS